MTPSEQRQLVLQRRHLKRLRDRQWFKKIKTKLKLEKQTKGELRNGRVKQAEASVRRMLFANQCEQVNRENVSGQVASPKSVRDRGIISPNKVQRAMAALVLGRAKVFPPNSATPSLHEQSAVPAVREPFIAVGRRQLKAL